MEERDELVRTLWRLLEEIALADEMMPTRSGFQSYVRKILAKRWECGIKMDGTEIVLPEKKKDGPRITDREVKRGP